MKKIKRFALLIALASLLASCGPGAEAISATAQAAATASQMAIPTPPPNPEIGEALFNKGFPETSGRSCHYCHRLNETESGRIPLFGLASYAAGRVEGLSAQAYIRQSILEPRAFSVEGFDPEAMPIVYGQVFSEEEIDHLVAFLLTLK